MRVIRSVIVFVLIFATLPWGAYARTFGPVQRVVEIVLADQVGKHLADPKMKAVQVAYDAAHVAVASATKRCRLAGLPGSPCGPDLRLPSETAVVVGLGMSTVVYPDRRPPLAGRVPAGLLDPPRSC